MLRKRGWWVGEKVFEESFIHEQPKTKFIDQEETDLHVPAVALLLLFFCGMGFKENCLHLSAIIFD